MDEFKKLEAKMKDYQKNKRVGQPGQRPPLAQSGQPPVLNKEDSRADLQI